MLNPKKEIYLIKTDTVKMLIYTNKILESNLQL